MADTDPAEFTIAGGKRIIASTKRVERMPRNNPPYFAHDASRGSSESFAWFQLDSAGYRGISTSVTGHVVYLDQDDLTTFHRIQTNYSTGNPNNGDLDAQTVRFDMAAGFYYPSQIVCCRFDSGKWFVLSPGTANPLAVLAQQLTNQATINVNVLGADLISTVTTLTSVPLLYQAPADSTFPSGSRVMLTQVQTQWFVVTLPCLDS